MSEGQGPLRAALIVPLFVYLGYLEWPALSSASSVILVVFFLSLGSVVAPAFPRARTIIEYAVFGAVAALILLAVFAHVLSPLDTFAGVLLATPLLPVGELVLDREVTGASVLTLQAAVVQAIVLLEATSALLAGRDAITGYNLMQAYYAALVTQAQSWYGLLVNGTLGSLPLQSSASTGLILLAALATLGALVPYLSPIPAARAADPAATASPATAGAEAALSAEARVRLAGRSAPVLPPFRETPGLQALVTAGLATSILLWVAYFAPAYLLLSVGGATVAAITVAVVRLAVPAKAPSIAVPPLARPGAAPERAGWMGAPPSPQRVARP